MVPDGKVQSVMKSVFGEDLPKSTKLWDRISRVKLASRNAAIPPEWRLRPGQIPDDQLNVMSSPDECGILTAREVAITKEESSTLLQGLISQNYTSREVGKRLV
jgi:amidase